MSRLMHLQHAAKAAIKTRLVPHVSRVVTIRHGPGRGLRAWLNPQHDLQRQWGLYESELSRHLRRHVTPDAVVYDIGAADGLVSLVCARMAYRGSVVAFEPDSEARLHFTANLRLNPELATAVRLVPEAVSRGMTSLDALVESSALPLPTFIKIDVDGGELEVLEGGAATLLRSRPVVLVETHSAALEASCAQWLQSRDWSVAIIPNARWRRIYPEWRPIGFNRWLLAEPGISGTGPG